jgi:hypothetical protein
MTGRWHVMTEGSSAAEGTEGGGRMQRLANVRFTPRKADICSAQAHVRFVPKADIKCLVQI